MRNRKSGLAIAGLAVVLLALPAVARKKERKMDAAAPKSTCTVVVPATPGALTSALAAAHKGDRLCLAAGEHQGPWTLVQSVTLQAHEAGSVVTLRGDGRGPVLRIDDEGLSVRLSGLTIRDGKAPAGGGLSVSGRGRVQVSDCVFEHNEAGQLGGGAVYAKAGHVTFERCTFAHNRARQGGALMFDMAMRAELKRCVVHDNEAEQAGALRVSEAAEVVVQASQLERNTGSDGASVRVSGTRSRSPKLEFDHCQVADGGLVNGPDIGGKVTARGSSLPASWKASIGAAGRNTWHP